MFEFANVFSWTTSTVVSVLRETTVNIPPTFREAHVNNPRSLIVSPLNPWGIHLHTYTYARNCILSYMHAFWKRLRGSGVLGARGMRVFSFSRTCTTYIKYFTAADSGEARIFSISSRDFRVGTSTASKGFLWRGAARMDAVMSETARKTLAAVNSSFRFWESWYVLRGWINLHTYSHVRCDTSHLSFVFRYTARLFRRYSTVRNMGRYLRCSPPANGALEYVDLCASARSETSFYLSFHGMDVKVEETGVPYAPSSLLSLSEYRFVRDRSFAHLISSCLILLVEIYGIGDVSVLSSWCWYT